MTVVKSCYNCEHGSDEFDDEMIFCGIRDGYIVDSKNHCSKWVYRDIWI